MARETITKLIDDIDGGEAAETVTFALDGVTYEIDLSEKNAAKLRKALENYTEHGTRVTARTNPVRAGRNGRVPGRSATVDREQNKAIRAWAEKKKLPIAPRGRIRADIIEQYHREAGR